jgi:hypothetical protein
VPKPFRVDEQAQDNSREAGAHHRIRRTDFLHLAQLASLTEPYGQRRNAEGIMRADAGRTQHRTSRHHVVDTTRDILDMLRVAMAHLCTPFFITLKWK